MENKFLFSYIIMRIRNMRGGSLFPPEKLILFLKTHSTFENNVTQAHLHTPSRS